MSRTVINWSIWEKIWRWNEKGGRITKEEAINKIKGYLTDYLPIEDYEEVEEIIKALKQEPKTGHWIPCSERMPEDGDDVIVTTGMGIYIGWFDADDHTWRLNNGYIMSIVAWMPLPNSYDIENEENK